MVLMQSDPAGTVHGRWILASKDQPQDYSCAASRFGLQPSGPAWDGELLWGISDQSSSCPGCLFTLRPGEIGEDTLLLQEDGLPITHQGEILPPDGEGIALLRKKGEELLFAVVVEDGSEVIGMIFDDRRPGAALVVRPQLESKTASVSEIWEFELAGEAGVRPYLGDTNRAFEGIAIDPESNRGYLAYEQAQDGLPRLFTFEIPQTTGMGSERIPVVLEPVALDLDFTPQGKPGTELNFNDLALHRQDGESPRLYVLCRNRELLLILTLSDPKTAVLHSQVSLHLRSPLGQAIEWSSPEGMALDAEANRLYLVSDPDPSCEGNWKATPGATLPAGQREAEADFFSQFVPLLFELDLRDVAPGAEE